jgi:rRNA processing protein Krr1/Pno1
VAVSLPIREIPLPSSLILIEGSNIRNIVVEAGGSDDRRDLARTVRFPRQGTDDTVIRLEGNKTVIDRIVASIEAFVAERNNQMTELIEVAPDKHRLLIGRGGETRRSLESKFKVSIDVPRATQQGPARSQIKVAGQAEDVAKATAHILELVKDQEGETVQVPRRSHHAISDNGRFFRRLHNDYNVNIDHAGQPLPAKPAATVKPKANGAALPLITDDPDALDNHVWDVVDHDEGQSEEGDIPWVLRGSPENVERARAALEKAMEQAQRQTPGTTATGYLILPDPRTHRFVIGAGGNQINTIRKQTGCKITVPKTQTKGEPIEIVGSRNGVEHAKDIILDVVQNRGNSGRMD